MPKTKRSPSKDSQKTKRAKGEELDIIPILMIIPIEIWLIIADFCNISDVINLFTCCHTIFENHMTATFRDMRWNNFIDGDKYKFLGYYMNKIVTDQMFDKATLAGIELYYMSDMSQTIKLGQDHNINIGDVALNFATKEIFLFQSNYKILPPVIESDNSDDCCYAIIPTSIFCDNCEIPDPSKIIKNCGDTKNDCVPDDIPYYYTYSKSKYNNGYLVEFSVTLCFSKAYFRRL